MALDCGSGPGPLKSNTQNNTLLKDKNKKNKKKTMLEGGLRMMQCICIFYKVQNQLNSQVCVRLPAVSKEK